MNNKTLALAIIASFFIGTQCARADIVTEFGIGYKTDSTSYLLQPDCRRAMVVDPEWPKLRRPPPQTFSCGGDNPAYIGWPIAWVSKPRGEHGAFTYKVGWFHYSNWFDGNNIGVGSWFHGDNHETHMDAIAGTITFNWTRWRSGKAR